MDIPEHPDIPTVLVAAAAARRLVPFVGSGVSAISKSPVWKDFALKSVEQAHNLGLIADPELKSFNDWAENRPRTAMSLIEQRERQKGIRLDYEAILHPNGMDPGPAGNQIYSALGRMATNFVTTNYDRWLDQRITDLRSSGSAAGPLLRRLVWNREEFSPEILQAEETVIHLHGRYTEPDSMITGASGYATHYRPPLYQKDEENRVLTFLETLFRDKCVLFMGYSLSDLEVLEYVVQKGHDPKRNRSVHYVLHPFKDSDSLPADLFDEYYKCIGLQMLPYSIGDTDFSRLAGVLDRLADHLPLDSPKEIEIEHDLLKLAESFE